MENPSNELKIQTPCPKTWEMLEGGERRRFCSECNLHVHNSEELTKAEATQLAADRSTRVCMRIVKDESGAPLFLDTAAGSNASTHPLSKVAGWALAAGAGLLSACRPEAPAPVEHTPTDGTNNGTLQATVGEVCPIPELGKVRFEEVLGDVIGPEPHEKLGEVVSDPDPEALTEE